MIRFVLSVISVNLYNDQTRCFVDRMGKYFSSLLGFSPVSHRGMVSSITPIVLPSGNSRQLNPKLIQQMKRGAFRIFQLDATAYPGNSGSPVFDINSGEVIGVINMVFLKGLKESALTHPSGISYAIPANFLGELIRQSAP
jgi:hypothetical protein